jgi:hypothetical protein
MGAMAATAVDEGSPERMRLTLAAVTVLAGAAATATAMNLGVERSPDALSVVRGLLVAAYAGVGAYTWLRRPASRFGSYVTLLGLFYAVASLSASSESIVHTVGRVALAVFIVGLVYAFLCFPHDRLASQLERRLVALLAAATAVIWALALAFVEELPAGGPLTDCGDSCPENALRLVTASEQLSSTISFGVSLVTAVPLLVVAVVLWRKARSPARLRRRLAAPLFLSVIVLALNYAAFTLLREGGVDATGALKVVGAASGLAIPASMLVGQIRGRVFAATSLGELVARVGWEPVTPAHLETLLRETLGDPLLTLALWDGPRAE